MNLDTTMVAPGDAAALAPPAEVADASASSPAATPVGTGRPLPWPEVWVAIVVFAAAVATAALFARGGGGEGLFLPALCLGATLVAAGFDGATGRIPNPVTYTAILLGLAVNALGVAVASLSPQVAAHWLGAAGPTEAAYGLLLFGGIGLVCRTLAGMGGGDMKLLAAVGAMLGLSRGADALSCALLVAVVYSVVNLLIRGRLNMTVRAAAVQAMNLVYLRDLTPAALPPSRRTIPLAVPVLLGVVLSRLPPVIDAAAWVRGVN